MTADYPERRGRQWQARRRGLALGCSAFLLMSVAHAVAADDRRWSISPLLGIHSPSLTSLNKGEFKAPLPGRGRLLFDQSDAGQDFDFVVDNPLPEMKNGAEGGIEIGFRLDERNTFFFGASVWESGSTSSVRTEMPFQGRMTPVGYERSGRISYFQYFLGWQRTLLSEARKFRLHGRIALHEIFDIDYKEDLVFGFDTGAETFNRVAHGSAWHRRRVLPGQLAVDRRRSRLYTQSAAIRARQCQPEYRHPGRGQSEFSYTCPAQFRSAPYLSR
jgi:hypothetical protein